MQPYDFNMDPATNHPDGERIPAWAQPLRPPSPLSGASGGAAASSWLRRLSYCLLLPLRLRAALLPSGRLALEALALLALMAMVFSVHQLASLSMRSSILLAGNSLLLGIGALVALRSSRARQLQAWTQKVTATREMKLQQARHPDEVRERLMEEATDYLLHRAFVLDAFHGDLECDDPGEAVLEALVEIHAAREGLQQLSSLLVMLDPGSPEHLLCDVLATAFRALHLALAHQEYELVDEAIDMDLLAPLCRGMEDAAAARAMGRLVE